MKKVINSPKAPKAIGPYSQAIEVNGMIYISGQLPVDVNTGKFAEGGIQEQTEQSLKNIGYILEAAGCTYEMCIRDRYSPLPNEPTYLYRSRTGKPDSHVPHISPPALFLYRNQFLS